MSQEEIRKNPSRIHGKGCWWLTTDFVLSFFTAKEAL